MARAFVAFYMGDYQKKTQHLETLAHGAYFLLLQHCWTHGAVPLDAAGRAAIARVTPQQWKKLAPVLNPFFDTEGRNKRATEEAEKAERISLRRAMAGQRGGFASGIAKAQHIGSKFIASATAKPKQQSQQKDGISIAIQNSKTITSESDAAREGFERIHQSGGSLATAPPAGALREPPTTGQEESGLVASLERLSTARATGHPPGRPVWIDWNTDEWHAHDHWRRSRAWKPLAVIKRIVDDVERQGQWVETLVPPSYDEATSEKLAPKDDEAAA